MILNENLNSNKAFMISKRAEEFPVKVHPYGSYEDEDDTSAAAEWLYNHIHNENAKRKMISFIKTWAIQGDPGCDENNLINDIIDYCDEYTDCYLVSKKFILDHKWEILEAEEGDLNQLNSFVIRYLNNNFLRARYGGRLDSDLNNKEMVFRVSSTGVNWFDIIWSFVYKNKREIDSVTIVRDPEATGENKTYIINGQKCFQMPINDFIGLPGKPVVEKLQID